MDRYSEIDDNVFYLACHLSQKYVNPDKEFHYVSMFLKSNFLPMTSFLIELVCQLFFKKVVWVFYLDNSYIELNVDRYP